MAHALVFEGINLRTSQGFSLVICLQGSCSRDQAKFTLVPGLEDLAIRVELGVDAWKEVAWRLGVPLSSTSALLSPAGSLLKHGQNDEDIIKEVGRYVNCLERAATEKGILSKPATPPIRHDADGWVQTIAKEQGRHQPNRSAADESQRGPARGIAALKVTSSVPNPDQSSQKPSAEPGPASTRGSAGDRSTKVRVRFSDGSPSQVLDVIDVSTVTLRDIMGRMNQPNIQSLALEYPRRTFDLARDSDRTLEALELTANPSLIAGTPETLRGRGGVPTIAYNNGFNSILHMLIAWLGALLAWLTRMFRSVIASGTASGDRPASAAARGEGNLRRQSPHVPIPDTKEDKKVNQYWNGDSTVFEGPADDPKDEDKKKN